MNNYAGITLLNGATGTLAYLKMTHNVYIVFGYVSVNTNTWFANLPVAPSNMYPPEGAKMIAIAADGTIAPISINGYAGMVAQKTGTYWIMGIVAGKS